ncbi:hypothetical protein ACFC3R_12205 [Enterococcus durans]|uniref:DUF6941 family protein n=1 Tax=Enterococcus durans TaxID=53345 RepID=UPI0039A719EF
MNEDINVKIIVSEDISSQNNGPNVSNVIVNPVLVLRAPFIPTALSLAVTILTSGIQGNQDHTMNIEIVNVQSGELIYTSNKTNFSIPSHSDNFTFSVDLKNLPFMNEGRYEVRFTLDEEIYNDSFTVVANKVFGVNL